MKCRHDKQASKLMRHWTGNVASPMTIRRQANTLIPPDASLAYASCVQVTSPLRKYVDVIAHRQIRLSLSGKVIFLIIF